MNEITQQNAQRTAMLLMASIKSVGFYPQAHPAVRQPLRELIGILEGMLREKPEIHLGVVEGVFFSKGTCSSPRTPRWRSWRIGSPPRVSRP